MIPKIGPNVAWQIVDGEAIVVDLASGSTIGLNPTGTFLWSKIDGGNDDASLAQAVAEEFEIATEIAESDTREFLTTMQSRALLVDAAERP
jgi:hypothetical protein